MKHFFSIPVLLTAGFLSAHAQTNENNSYRKVFELMEKNLPTIEQVSVSEKGKQKLHFSTFSTERVTDKKIKLHYTIGLSAKGYEGFAVIEYSPDEKYEAALLIDEFSPIFLFGKYDAATSMLKLSGTNLNKEPISISFHLLADTIAVELNFDDQKTSQEIVLGKRN